MRVQPSKCLCLATGKILRPSLEVTRDTTTYNCPWVNTGLGRYTPTRSKLWPWLFMIVIAKATRTGNWHRRIVNGRVMLDGVMKMWGMNTRSPMWVPVMISASRTCCPSYLIMSLVPLHKLADTFRLCNSMIGVPFFNTNRWCAMLPILSEFRNSTGNRTLASTFVS